MATSGGHTARLTGKFDFQHETSYQCSIVTIALKCAVLSYGHGTERKTDKDGLCVS